MGNLSCNRYTEDCFKKSKSKTVEATGDLIDNKIADKITNISSQYVPETNLRSLASLLLKSGDKCWQKDSQK